MEKWRHCPTLPRLRSTEICSARVDGFNHLDNYGQHGRQVKMGHRIMQKKYLVFFLAFFLALLSGFRTPTIAQQGQSGTRLRVVVDLVQLNVAVTDSKGNYVTDLRPSDFTITEDGISEKIANFEEGNGPTRTLVENMPEETNANAGDASAAQGRDPAVDRLQGLNAALAGADVFILFDTSNYMYRGFVFAQDAISDFIRSLETVDKVAFYSYSRNLSRAAPLTADRAGVVRGVRTTVAGDDAALYNCLLLTVKDAAQYPGRKVVVVFSNGPDNASMVPPEDVTELAQSVGIPVYMISTAEAQLQPVSTAVFERMSAATGGKAYFAGSWRDEKKAFASIRNDLAHLYLLSYYPAANPNRGWRTITVKLAGDRLKKCHIRTRNGYRPQPSRLSAVGDPAAQSQSVPN
jgi:Ca-activated chloride channel family protein